ncbi:MAG: IS1595 family transposase, partial [Bryobacteraceae bacterium]
METPDTLRDAIIWFAEFENCRQFMIELRWADGVVKCPRCESEHVFYIPKERVWKCYGKHDRPKFSLKTGTIFEDSPITLEKWLPAVWLIVGCKNGISSYELSRDLKVTQKSAWFMLHRIRLAMQSGTFNKLSGEIEVDETFIGGKARNMHKGKRAEKIQGRGAEGKEIVFGMNERGGDVRVMHVEKRTKAELQSAIREHVEAGAAIFSDELLSYDGLSADYQHAVINHAVEYVNGNVHTNGMENFWSLLKRGLHGTYISVEPFHLFRDIDEQAFRFNNRRASDAERFTTA